MNEDELLAAVRKIMSRMRGQSGSVTLHFDVSGELSQIEYRTFERLARGRAKSA